MRIDPTGWDMRDPHTHDDLHAEDWPIAVLLIVAILAIPFTLGFTLGRIWA